MKADCANFIHDWQENYYGIECKECGAFVPDGCGPWMPDEVEIARKIDAAPGDIAGISGGIEGRKKWP